MGVLFFSFVLNLHFQPLILPISSLVLGCIILVFIKSIKSEFNLYWLVALLYALFIFFLSNNSFNQANPSINTNFFHIIEFFSLGILIGLCFINKKIDFKDLYLKVLILGMTYGLLDELHQYFVPDRHSSLVDLLLDGIGLFFSLFFLYFLSLRIQSND